MTDRPTSYFADFGAAVLAPGELPRAPLRPHRVPMAPHQAQPLAWLEGRSAEEIMRASRYGLMLPAGRSQPKQLAPLAGTTPYDPSMHGSRSVMRPSMHETRHAPDFS